MTEHTTDISNIKSKNAEQDTTIENLTNNVSNITNQYSSINTTVENQSSTINSLQQKNTELESLVNSQKSTIENLISSLNEFRDRVPYNIELKSNAEISHPDDNIVLTASGTITGTNRVNGKSVTLKTGTFESATFKSTVNTSCTLSGINSTGALSESNNVAWAINGGTIHVSGCTLAQTGDTAFNLSTDINNPASSITMEDMEFTGALTGDGIAINAVQDNAVITLKNCHWTSAATPVRIYNTGNKHITINLENCKADAWSEAPNGAMIVFEDNTSASAEECASNNLFASDKITLNITGCTSPSGLITTVSDLSTVVASKDAAQLLYIYLDNGDGVLAYTGNESRYPTITIA